MAETTEIDLTGIEKNRIIQWYKQLPPVVLPPRKYIGICILLIIVFFLSIYGFNLAKRDGFFKGMTKICEQLGGKIYLWQGDNDWHCLEPDLLTNYFEIDASLGIQKIKLENSTKLGIPNG